MKKMYSAPEIQLIELQLTDTILDSLPTEKPIEMPILSRRVKEYELYGDPGLDPEVDLDAAGQTVDI